MERSFNTDAITFTDEQSKENHFNDTETGYNMNN